MFNKSKHKVLWERKNDPMHYNRSWLEYSFGEEHLRVLDGTKMDKPAVDPCRKKANSLLACMRSVVSKLGW